MAKIKHIAIATQNEEATAKFYIDAFGLTQIGKIDIPIVSGYFLSDGTMNLAILHFKNDQVAGTERGKEWSGIHHIGFEVESLEEIAPNRRWRWRTRPAMTSTRHSNWYGGPSTWQCRGQVQRS